MHATRLVVVFAPLFFLVACNAGDDANATTQASVSTALPLTAPQPSANPTSTAKVALGRLLFWDPILSGNQDVACATCHHPDFAYTDGAALSVGVGGVGLGPSRTVSATAPERTTRNAMTVLNAAFNGLHDATVAIDASAAPMFWDSRASSLENQARGPITATGEMCGMQFNAGSIFPTLVTRLEAIPEYASEFTAAFGTTAITEDEIVQAIAAFERTLVSTDSSYDLYAKGDSSALTASAQRGLQVFQNNGCSKCHTGPMFSDFQLHRLGVRDLTGAVHDSGAGNDTFRTGSLRNVTRTAPYMHNGSLATLNDVFRFYDRINQNLDPNLRGLRAPEGQDATDVQAFLEALSDGSYDRTVPSAVPSGLGVAGDVQ